MSGSNRRRCCCGNPLCDDVSFFCSTCEQQVPSRQPVSYSMFFHDVEVLKLNGCIKCPDSFGAGTFGNYSFGRQFIDKCGSNARINRKLLAGTSLNNCYYSQTDSLPGGGEVNPGVPGFLYWYEYGGGAGFPPGFDCTCGTPTSQVGFAASMELGVDGNQVRVQVLASYIEDFTGSHNIWGWIIFDGTGGSIGHCIDDFPITVNNSINSHVDEEEFCNGLARGAGGDYTPAGAVVTPLVRVGSGGSVKIWPCDVAEGI
jgi:hypothetical protein